MNVLQRFHTLQLFHSSLDGKKFIKLWLVDCEEEMSTLLQVSFKLLSCSFLPFYISM